VVIGEPVPLEAWFARLEHEGRGLFTLPRSERLGEIQALADDAMQRVGGIIPVTPVPLVCAAIQTLDADFISREQLIARVLEMRESLAHHGRQLLNAHEDAAVTLDRAYELLRLRRVISREGGGYVVLPRGRELISYYANSIAHLFVASAR